MLIDIYLKKFLLLCIITELTALAPPALPTDVDVIIIGAGWSGMGAADHLARSNFSNFLVLEATNKTGGRTESFEFGDPSVGRFIFERGSNWISGAPFNYGPDHENNRIYREALKVKKTGTFNITLIPGGTQNQSNFWAVYDSNGKPADLDGRIRRQSNAAYICINRTSTHIEKDINMRDALIKCGWEPKTEVEWVIDWGFTADIPGISATKQSLQMGVPDKTYDWYGDDDWFVLDQNPRGFSHLMDTMTADTVPTNDPRLVFNTIVTQIDYTSIPIKVTSKDGRVFNAKHVISTLPLGVMQRNHKTLFVPSLPADQVEALTSKGAHMSHLTKVYLQFKEPFWDPKIPRWLAADPELGLFAEWHNMNHPLHVPGSNTLFIWMGEPQSTKFEKGTDAEVIAAVMKNLQQRYPEKKLVDPVAFYMTRHSLDPFRYGSYSAYEMGWTDQYWDVMKRPLKAFGDIRVYFGGEHTCKTLTPFTHGALKRGHELAAEYLGQHYIKMCDA